MLDVYSLLSMPSFNSLTVQSIQQVLSLHNFTIHSNPNAQLLAFVCTFLETFWYLITLHISKWIEINIELSGNREK